MSTNWFIQPGASWETVKRAREQRRRAGGRCTVHDWQAIDAHGEECNKCGKMRLSPINQERANVGH